MVSKNDLASPSEPNLLAGSLHNAVNKTESCLPGPNPNLDSKYFLAFVMENPPGILDDINLPIKEVEVFPNDPENVSWNCSANSSNGVSSGFSGVDPNSLPKSPKISF